MRLPYQTPVHKMPAALDVARGRTSPGLGKSPNLRAHIQNFSFLALKLREKARQGFLA